MTAPQPDEGKQPPRTWYYGSGGPYSGDDDFMTFQHRSQSINRWDVWSVALLVLSFVAGAAIWRFTGNVVLANVVFWSLLALSVAYAIRKWLWSHTGS
ncbi:MAG: hypothetical protein AAF531_22075 [Actinomycetota bacterium]